MVVNRWCMLLFVDAMRPGFFNEREERICNVVRTNGFHDDLSFFHNTVISVGQGKKVRRMCYF